MYRKIRLQNSKNIIIFQENKKKRHEANTVQQNNKQTPTTIAKTK